MTRMLFDADRLSSPSEIEPRDEAPITPLGELTSPEALRKRTDRLLYERRKREERSQELAKRFQELNPYLEIADKVTVALEQLNENLFQNLLGIVQEKLTVALQEILEQPIELKASAEFKRGSASVDFWIDRAGNREHVLNGQGGSVANILSVGLRLFALTTLDEAKHRRFLVLDEQDCWLRPDLVPRLVKIVRDAGRALGFQVLMISHHDRAIFDQYADRIYEFLPKPDGSLEVCLADSTAAVTDSLS